MASVDGESRPVKRPSAGGIRLVRVSERARAPGRCGRRGGRQVRAVSGLAETDRVGHETQPEEAVSRGNPGGQQRREGARSP